MSNYVHAYLNTPILFNPYQYKPLMQLRRFPQKNILISDEVGLGKTIEAGIIIDDLIKRKPNAHILIICPAFLRNKWMTELEEKFYINAYIINSRYDYSLSNVTILPVSRLASFDKNDTVYDMIIVDEIHYFKNSASMRYSYLRQLLENNLNARKVFMSATPINNTSADWYSISRLLGEHTTTNTTKKQSYIDLKKRNIHDIWLTLSYEEQKIYDSTDYLDPFGGTIYRHIGASSVYALIQYANKSVNNELRAEIEEAKEMLGLDQEENLNMKAVPQINDVLPEIDTKLKLLLDVLNETGSSHVVIFSHYIETVKYLYEQIRSHSFISGLGKDNVGYIYANHTSINIPLKNRKNRFSDVKKWFDDTSGRRILVCSDSCKEGVDLQVASVLINYDLPFNPSIVEQRIGRIDRTGQLSDMEIYNFHVENTYDDRLHMILTTKLRLINYFGEYGIGNPLQITDNRSRILESFLKYSDKLEMSNDDIETILRMLRDIYKDVPTIQSVKKDKTVLGKYVSSHTQGIYKWFENVTDRHEKEELQKAKDKFINDLDFPESPGIIDLSLDSSQRKTIADNCNSDPLYRMKAYNLIYDQSDYLTMLEEYGENKELTEKDIKHEHIINYDQPSPDTFVPYEIIKTVR